MQGENANPEVLMRIEALLDGIDVRARWGEAAAVCGLHYDSRQIGPGMAFVAIRGEQVDGNDYIAQAVARGAAVILSEHAAPEGAAPAWVRVANARAALAQAATNWFRHPAAGMRLVGITGTNGKTTTAYLIEAMLRQAGWRVGLLGTIEYHVGDAILPAPHTTPESYELQALLAQMAAASTQGAVMEVSSHALAMERVWGLRFAVAVFTNLTQDHLDFHGTMAGYEAAKKRLFAGVGALPPLAAVVNSDDAAAAGMTQGFAGPVLRFGFGDGAQLRARRLENTPRGLRFRLSGPEGWEAEVASPLLGRVNAYNLLAAIGAGMALGLEPRAAVAGASSLERVRGRFERVYAGQPFTVVVDYAHTPDALANVLRLARELARGRVLVTFGCGGERDRGKRPWMGEAAARGADWVMVTSDNPRGEDPLAIINDILVGAQRAGDAIHSQPDRRMAIREALREARAGDIVVVAGKGHEDFQIIGGERRAFDDVGVARRELAELGWRA